MVALLLVLPGAAAHQDVAVLQLLRRPSRQARATLPARGTGAGASATGEGPQGTPPFPGCCSTAASSYCTLFSRQELRERWLPKSLAWHSRPTEGDELPQLVQLDLALHGLGLRQGTHVQGHHVLGQCLGKQKAVIQQDGPASPSQRRVP